MKKITLFILLASIFSATGGCNNEVDNPLPPCDPDVIGQDVKFYANQTGVLTFADSISGGSLPFPAFFILSDKNNSRGFTFADGASYLPLDPCNLPENEFNLKPGNQIDILFSGNVTIYPPTIDAGTVPVELTMIQKLNPIDQ